MTDRDVVDRVAALWGRAVITLLPKQDGHKVAYATTIKGSPSVGLMDLARRHMGRRRREQIDRAVGSWHGHATIGKSPSAFTGFTHPTCDATCALAWLAGLLEGEGCFTINWNAGRGYPVIYVTMCDQDVVDRAGAMLGATNVRFDPPRHQRWQPTSSRRSGGTGLPLGCGHWRHTWVSAGRPRSKPHSRRTDRSGCQSHPSTAWSPAA